MREFIVQAVAKTGGHLGSNLGAVELTIALHRIFKSPHDVIIWDTGHQTYVHKMITGRQADFRNSGKETASPAIRALQNLSMTSLKIVMPQHH